MKFYLEIVAGPQAGSQYPLGESLLTIGRLPSADISFPEDNFISGMHCAIQSLNETVQLKDLNSTNGTYLNGERISEARVNPGDRFKAGSIVFELHVEQPPKPETHPPQTPSVDLKTLELFASLTEPLYCLLDAACDPTIPSLLALTQEKYQCLYDGDSAATLARWAPYLVQLPPSSPFTKALLDLGWGKGWASYFTSTASFEEIRHHFRKFLMVQIEDGQEVYFRFYDPRVLREFLPTATEHELVVFYGPVDRWLIEAEDPSAMLILRQSKGLLDSQSVDVTNQSPD